MIESEPSRDEVSVVFRRGTSLFIPISGALALDQRSATEDYESVVRRICDEHGVYPGIDYALHAAPRELLEEGQQRRGFMVRVEHPGTSLEYTPHDEVLKQVERERTLSRLDRHFVQSAHTLLGTDYRRRTR